MAFKSYLEPKTEKKIVAPVAEVEAAVPVITDDDLLSPELVAEVKAEAAATHAVAAAMPTGQISMSAAELAAVIAAVSSKGNEGLAEAFAAAMTQHLGPRKLTAADIGEAWTPFNPNRLKRELKCDFYQNGFMIQERFVSDDEIAMLHQLVPGSYGTTEFPVAVVEKKRLNGKTRIFIMYADGKDDRLRQKMFGVNFHAMLVRLVAEAKEQKAQRRAEARALLAEE